MKKRLLALALVFCLALALLPGTAAAAARPVVPQIRVEPLALAEDRISPQAGAYTITLKSTGPGVAELDTTKANARDRVYFLADPEPGYRVSFDKCGYQMDQYEMKLYYIGGNIYEMVMPDGDVLLDLEFVAAEGKNHPVTVEAGTGGMVSVSQTEAKPGESIFVEVVAAPAAKVGPVTASCNGGKVEVYELGRTNGAELFEIFMPDGELEIEVEFIRNGPYAVDSLVLSGEEEPGGSLELSHQQAYEGDIVTVRAIPDRGWEVLDIMTEKGTELIPEGENVWSFQMPRYAEAVWASFARIHYPVSVRVEEPVGGTAVLDTQTATIGQTVTLTCTPEEGYRVARIQGVEELTDNGDGTYNFVMDAQAVELSVLFLRENNPFLDVNENHFYHDSVLWAVEMGITNGVDPEHFGPTGLCNRAQVVTFLWRAAGSPVSAGENPFADVAEGTWYTDAVLWAVEMGITNGLTETTFGPGTVCNRAQVVTFLWRAMGCPEAEMEHPFDDVAAGSWYEMPVRWALENGVTTGQSATAFGPGGDSLRAQVVTFLYRAEQIPKQEEVPEVEPEI